MKFLNISEELAIMDSTLGKGEVGSSILPRGTIHSGIFYENKIRSSGTNLGMNCVSTF